MPNANAPEPISSPNSQSPIPTPGQPTNDFYEANDANDDNESPPTTESDLVQALRAQVDALTRENSANRKKILNDADPQLTPYARDLERQVYALQNFLVDPTPLFNHTTPPSKLGLDIHQVWIWVNGPTTPHWEIRGTGAKLDGIIQASAGMYPPDEDPNA